MQNNVKTLLISANVASSPYPVYPLGLSMIASALTQIGCDVSQFDFLQSGASLAAVTAAVKTASPDIVGISLRNIDNTNMLNEQKYVPVVRDIIQTIRAHSDCCIIIGGSGFSIMPDVILDEVGADYGIVGEGERLIVEFVKDYMRGELPKERCIRSAPSLEGNEIPSACYDKELMRFYQGNGNLAAVQTKRGCPHKCIYCSYPVLEGSQIRHRDPADVVADIKLLTDVHKAGYIFFTDSVFNDDEGHFREVVALMHAEGINVPWTAFFKPDGLDDEIVALMKKTGLHAAEMGSDASNDTALKGLGKSFRFKDILASNALLAQHDVATAHYFMFGCPGETEARVLEGIRNIKSLPNAAVFIFMGIRILPGTALARLARNEGLLTENDRDLLEPTYYIAPGLDQEWLEKTLREAFADVQHCVFPPDAMDSKLHFLHQMGHVGPLWDLLLKQRSRERRRP